MTADGPGAAGHAGIPPHRLDPARSVCVLIGTAESNFLVVAWAVALSSTAERALRPISKAGKAACDNVSGMDIPSAFSTGGR